MTHKDNRETVGAVMQDRLQEITEDARRSNSRSGVTMAEAAKALEALNAIAEIYRDGEGGDSGQEFHLERTYEPQYILQALDILGRAKEAIALDIRALVEWAAYAAPGLSTHELGRAGRLSNSTVARWQKTARERGGSQPDGGMG